MLCRVDLWRYSNLVIESKQVFPTVCLMTDCLPNHREIGDAGWWRDDVIKDESCHCELENNTDRTLRYLNSMYFFKNNKLR
jgi:hypothetical protein